MALTLRGRQLTEAHRLLQTRIGADTIREMSSLWSLLDLTELDRTSPDWLRVAVSLVKRQHVRSAEAAANYYALFRATELSAPAEAFSAVMPSPLNVARVATSLTTTGPVRVKQAMTRGVNLATASDTALSTSAAAAERLALDGGRSAIEANIASDGAARGYYRAPSGNACAFCLVVASQGLLFATEDAAGFESHDSCHCQPEPVFSENAPYPPGVAAARQRYFETPGGLKEFRASIASDPLD